MLSWLGCLLGVLKGMLDPGGAVVCWVAGSSSELVTKAEEDLVSSSDMPACDLD